MSVAHAPQSTSTKALRIGVLGSTGSIGRRVVAEALSRAHRVSAVSRRQPDSGPLDANLTCVSLDVTRDDLTQLARDHDVLIAALRPPAGREDQLPELTRRVVDGALEAGTRFIIVGGAGSLTIPSDPAHTVLTAPGFLPDEWRPIAQACQVQYEETLPRLGSLGVYVSPPAMLVPGERTGSYETGEDALVVDAQNESRISIEDFGVALIDEAESGAHTGRRFTVGYAN